MITGRRILHVVEALVALVLLVALVDVGWWLWPSLGAAKKPLGAMVVVLAAGAAWQKMRTS